MWITLKPSLKYLRITNSKIITNKKSLSNKIKENSKDDEIKKYTNLIMFDFDHTLIIPKNSIHPKHLHDWKWLHKEIEEKFKKLKLENVQIVIVSNQRGYHKYSFVLERMQRSLSTLNISLEVYVSIEHDIYRKPFIGIFQEFIVPKLQSNIIYVGDAAGRQNDFSDSDRRFAYNIQVWLKYINSPYKISFYTPEEYFLDKEYEIKEWKTPLPQSYLTEINLIPRLTLLNNIKKNCTKTLYLIMGPPVSGKTILAEQIIKVRPDIEYIDYEKSSDIKQQNKSSSLIIEGMFPSKKSRKKIINYAKEHSYHIDIINMQTFKDNQKNKNLYMTINNYKFLLTGNRTPEVVFDNFYKNFEEPDTSEGIITNIPIYIKFKNRLSLALFLMS